MIFAEGKFHEHQERIDVKCLRGSSFLKLEPRMEVVEKHHERGNIKNLIVE